MSKSKNYFCLGIVLTIIATVVSLMCIVFSYAIPTDEFGNTPNKQASAVDVNDAKQESDIDVNDNNHASEQLTIKFDCSKSTAPAGTYSFKVSPEGCWDESTQTITLPEGTVSYHVGFAGIPEKYMHIVLTGGGNPINVWAICDANIRLCDWGVTMGEQTTSSVFYPIFEKIEDAESGKICGTVEHEESYEPVSDVQVTVQDNQTSEIKWRTTTSADGSFEIDNIEPEFFEDFAQGLYPNLELCFCYPGFLLSTRNLSECSWSYDDEKHMYIVNSGPVLLENSERINFYGFDKHQSFNFAFHWLHVYQGEIAEKIDNKYSLSCVSLSNFYFDVPPYNVKFEITEDGIINGVGEYILDEDNYACITISLEPVCDEGYVFDYVELNGEKHYKNQELFTDDKFSTYNSTVHYKQAGPLTNFKVKGQVVDIDGYPIPNTEIGFYNSDVSYCFDAPLIKSFTAQDGTFELDGCYSGVKDPYKFCFTHCAINYENIGEGIAEDFDFDDVKDGVYEVEEPIVLEPANFTCCCDTPHHQYFTFTVKGGEPGTEFELLYNRNLEYVCMAPSDFASNDEGIVYDILEDGTLSYTTDSEIITIKPCSDEGYKFSNYLVNDKTIYIAGDSISVDKIVDEDDEAHIAVNYVENGQGGGGQGGGGQGQETDVTTQTGDTGVYTIVILGLMAIATAAIFIYRRGKTQSW